MYELIYNVLHYNIVRASPLIRSPKQLIKRTLRSIYVGTKQTPGRTHEYVFYNYEHETYGPRNYSTRF